MKTGIVAFVVLLLLVQDLHAQQEADRTKPPAPEFTLTTAPFRNFYREINIGASKRLGWEQTLELRIGYMHHNRLLDPLWTDYLTSTDMKFDGAVVYVSWSKWYYNKEMHHRYWGLTSGYRYGYFQNGTMWLGGLGGSSFAESLQLSQWRNEIIFLASWGGGKRKHMVTEVSLGMRVIQTHTYVIDTRFHPPATDYEEYKQSVVDNQLPHGSGVTVGVLFRITTRLGLFEW